MSNKSKLRQYLEEFRNPELNTWNFMIKVRRIQTNKVSNFKNTDLYKQLKEDQNQFKNASLAVKEQLTRRWFQEGNLSIQERNVEKKEKKAKNQEEKKEIKRQTELKSRPFKIIYPEDEKKGFRVYETKTKNVYESVKGDRYLLNQQKIGKKVVKNWVSSQSQIKKPENKKFEVTFERIKYKDTDQEETRSNLDKMVIESSDIKSAEKLANELLDMNLQKSKGRAYEWFSAGYKFKSIKEVEKNRPVSILDEKLYDVSSEKIMDYQVFDCDMNLPEEVNSIKFNNCVLQFLYKSIWPITNEGCKILNKKTKTGRPCKGSFRNIDEKWLTREFNMIRNQMKLVQCTCGNNPLLCECENPELNEQQLDIPIIGISPREIAEFCKKWKFSNYVCDTMGNEVYYYNANHGLPAIAYVTNCSHLYPIYSHEAKVQLRERFKKVKNNVNNDDCEENSKEIIDYTIVSTIDDVFEYGLYGTIFLENQVHLNEYVYEEMKNRNVIFTRRQYDLDEGGNIIKFYDDDMTLICNSDIRTVLKCCNILNTPFENQSLISIGTSLLNDKHKIEDKLVCSVLNNNVFNMLCNSFRGGFNNTFNTVEDKSKLIGYDICKQYTSILRNNDNEFPLFNPFCDVEDYEDSGTCDFINNHLYYIKTLNFFPLRYDGLYYGFILNYCRQNNIAFKAISTIKPSGSHSSFNEDVDTIYEKLGSKLGKYIVNAIIGCLGKNKKTITDIYYDNNLTNASYIFSKKCEIKLQNYIAKACDEPTIYSINNRIRKQLIETNMPVHMYITQMGNLQTHMMTNQMNGKIIRIVVDGVIVENGNEIIDNIGNDFGNYKKLTLEECQSKVIGNNAKVNIPKMELVLKHKKNRVEAISEWNIIDIDEQNYKSENWCDNVAEKIFESQGCFISGLAGVGKSYIYKALEKLLEERNIKLYKCAFTNNASRLIKGQTLHRLFCLSACDKIEKANLSSLHKGDWLFIDEVSLIHSKFYPAFIRCKTKGVNIVIAGDFNQLDPVHETIFNKEDSVCLKQLVNCNKIELKINKRSDNKMFDLYNIILFGTEEQYENITESFQWSDLPPSENEYHITYTNKTCNRINGYLMKKLSKDLNEDQKTHFNAIETKEGYIHCMTLWKDAPIMCYKSKKIDNNGQVYYALNNTDYKVDSWTEDNIVLTDEEDNLINVSRSLFPYVFKSGFASTCHKAQGRTILGNIRIWDLNCQHVDRNWLYTAVSRTVSWNNIYLSNYDFDSQERPFHTFTETINYDALQYIHDNLENLMDNGTITQMKDYKNGYATTQDKKTMQSIIETYMNSFETKSGLSSKRVEYNYVKNTDEGRLFSDSYSLQKLPKVIRHTLCFDENGESLYNDIDMVNAHPTILIQFCKKYNIDCGLFEDYVNNRDYYLQSLMNLGLTRDQAKEIPLSIMNGGKRSHLYPNVEWIQKMEHDIKNIFTEYIKTDIGKTHYKRAKNKKNYNIEGSTLNYLLCREENRILHSMIDFYKVENIGALCFDGLMVYRNIDINLGLCSEHIKNQTGYDIKLSCKPMDMAIKF